MESTAQRQFEKCKLSYKPEQEGPLLMIIQQELCQDQAGVCEESWYKQDKRC